MSNKQFLFRIINARSFLPSTKWSSEAACEIRKASQSQQYISVSIPDSDRSETLPQPQCDTPLHLRASNVLFAVFACSVCLHKSVSIGNTLVLNYFGLCLFCLLYLNIFSLHLLNIWIIIIMFCMIACTVNMIEFCLFSKIFLSEVFGRTKLHKKRI